MSWSLYRWVWQLEAPLFIGMPPAGSLNRCRLYVPARAIWGAITAELAQHQANGFPEYQRLGRDVREKARFTYLYPAERANGSWLAWLPHYAESNGLSWHREGSAGSGNGSVPDRQFRRWLLDTRPATAIDPESDSAEERSLRETECLMTNWRCEARSPRPRVGLVGYVFLLPDFREELFRIGTLFLGGDTRYGLGRVRRLECERATHIFNAVVEANGQPDAGNPIVSTKTILGHSPVESCGRGITGAVEPIAGWDRAGGALLKPVSGRAWLPGSRASIDVRIPSWVIDPSGFWKRFSE